MIMRAWSSTFRVGEASRFANGERRTPNGEH
jgi:hypothetical protein